MKRYISAVCILLCACTATQAEEPNYSIEFSEYTTTAVQTTAETTTTSNTQYSYIEHTAFIGDTFCRALSAVSSSEINTADCTAEELEASAADMIGAEYPYVYLQIGAADIAQGTDKDEYASHVLRCAAAIREKFPNTTVIILGNTPVRTELEYRTYVDEDDVEHSVKIDPAVRQYNDALALAVERQPDLGIHYIDISIALADKDGILTDKADSGNGVDISEKGISDVMTLLEENRYTDFIRWEDRYRYMYPDFYSPGRPDYTVTNGKVVYLTFDDGPSKYTPEILDILAANDIKATFFVTGWNIDGKEDILKREADEGHTIGLHSQTHEYDLVYASPASFFDEFDQVGETVEDITGIKSWCLRFPGGSINNHNKDTRDAILKELKRRGYEYFDWNCATLDATADASVEYCLQSLKDSVKADHSVLLMHDTVEYTPLYLQSAIDYLKEQGYSFETVDTADPSHFKK